jgi:hypothetical protein
VFFCLDCAKGFNLGKEKLTPFNLFFIKPKIEKNLDQVYFPFWELESEITVLNQLDSTEDSRIVVFYIPSFFIKNINYFGDIGYYYLKKEVSLEREPRKTIPVYPGDRDLKNAASYPQIYSFKEESLKREKGSFGVSVKHRKAALLLIPFYKTEQEYLDSILLWKYPSGALI